MSRLVSLTVDEIISYWRPEESDTSWDDFEKQLKNRALKRYIGLEKRIAKEGFECFQSYILLGNDDVVWDGVSRLIVARKLKPTHLKVLIAEPNEVRQLWRK